VAGLERVARPNLKHAGLPLDLSKVGPVHRRIQVVQSGIPHNAEPGAARVHLAKVLMIGDDASN
jgi:hypothetical protein